jgi:hypothetical protein
MASVEKLLSNGRQESAWNQNEELAMNENEMLEMEVTEALMMNENVVPELNGKTVLMWDVLNGMEVKL